MVSHAGKTMVLSDRGKQVPTQTRRFDSTVFEEANKKAKLVR